MNGKLWNFSDSDAARLMLQKQIHLQREVIDFNFKVLKLEEVNSFGEVYTIELMDEENDNPNRSFSDQQDLHLKFGSKLLSKQIVDNKKLSHSNYIGND